MPDVERRLAAILSADVVGYSRLMAEDESATIRTLTAYREQIATLVREHRGRVVDAPGDNLLAEFPSASEAVSCAVEIQGVLKVRNAPLPAERKMEFRIGVHVGEVRVEGERIYGDGVNIAARLEGLAEAGGICISGMVHEQVERKLGLRYEDLGEQSVKNIPKPVRVYKLQAEPAVARPTLQRRRSGRWLVLTGIAALLVVAGAATFWGLYLRPVRPVKEAMRTETASPQLPEKRSIAVLPFVNMTGDPKQEYFSDGITEQIITELSRFRELFVIGRSSTFQYKDQRMDPRKVGQELDARYVLEGSVRKVADRIRVTAQLLDATSGAHLWAESYDRDLAAADILGVQDEIATQVVAAIAGEFGVISRAALERSKEKEIGSLDSYDCLLRARAYWRTLSREEHFSVRRCLENALERDPEFAEGWAALTFIYLDEERWGSNPLPNPLERALQAAQRAVDLDPANSNAHQALAFTYFYLHQLDLFFVEAERALVLNPNDPDTLADLGDAIAFAGQWDRGVEMVKRALELDPAPPGWYHIALFFDHYRRGEYQQALAQARKMNMPRFYLMHKFLAMAYGQLGEEENARASLSELRRLYPGYTLEIAAKEARFDYFTADLTERVLDGLRKAGLK